MRPTVNQSKITIPTGYEELQRQALSKRRLSDIMLERGLGPQGQQNSYAQLFGQLAQAYAGKKLGKDASKLEAEGAAKIKQDYTDARSGFYAATQGGQTPEQLVETFGSNPLLKDDVDPYRAAMAAALKERGEHIMFNGKYVPKASVMGQTEFDPNKSVIPDGNGNYVVNEVYAAAQGLGNGSLTSQDPQGGTTPLRTSAPIPQMQAPAPPPQASAPPQAPAQVLDFAQAVELASGVSPENAANFLKSADVAIRLSSIEQASQLPPGTRIVLPDGTLGYAQ